jgi:hypothetical protein
MRYGRGFSTTNLRYFRTFYTVYSDRIPEIRHIACGEFKGQGKRHTQSGVLDAMAFAVEQIGAERGFSPNLGWSHYRTLMNVENQNERLFYEIEAENEGWDVEHRDAYDARGMEKTGPSDAHLQERPRMEGFRVLYPGIGQRGGYGLRLDEGHVC